MYTIYLGNGHAYDCIEVSMEPKLVLVLADGSAFVDFYSDLTPENLANVEVYKDGARSYGLTGCSLIGCQTVNNPDGSLTVHVYMTGQQEAAVSPAWQMAYETLTGGMSLEDVSTARAEIESMAQEIPQDSRAYYARWFPVWAPKPGGYRQGYVVRYGTDLYENLLSGNIKDPAEMPVAWRRIDPLATDMNQYVA